MLLNIFVTVVRARMSGVGHSGRIFSPDVRTVIMLYYCLYVVYSDRKFGLNGTVIVPRRHILFIICRTSDGCH